MNPGASWDRRQGLCKPFPHLVKQDAFILPVLLLQIKQTWRLLGDAPHPSVRWERTGQDRTGDTHWGLKLQKLLFPQC